MLRNVQPAINYKKLIELQVNGTSYRMTRIEKKNSKYQTQRRNTKQMQKKLRRYL